MNLAKALEQLGIDAKVVSSPICLNADVSAGLGGDFPKWTYAIASRLSDPTDPAASHARRMPSRQGRRR